MYVQPRLKMKERVARTNVLKARTNEVTITPTEMGTVGLRG
jgi:hypothetical protein